METTDIIKDLIAENRLEEAIELLNRRIEQNKKDDKAYYLLGNIFRKKGDWKQATFYYLSATEINPESPAKQAQEVLVDIHNYKKRAAPLCTAPQKLDTKLLGCFL